MNLPNAWNAILLLLLGVVLYWFVCRWREYLSDLSCIPNAHPLAPWTSLWITWIRWQGTELETVRSAFEKYGPMVRVGPKDIFLASIDDVKDDVYGYGSSNMDKYPGYQFYKLLGSQTMFTSLTNEAHRTRKRRFARYYTQSFLTNTPYVQKIISANICKLKLLIETAISRDGILDGVALFDAFGIDILSALLYGSSSGTNFLSDFGALKEWVHTYHETHLGNGEFWLAEFPVLDTLLRKIGLDPLPHRYYDAIARFEAWGFERFIAAKGEFEKGNLESEEEPTIFGMMRTNLLGTATDKTWASIQPGSPQFREMAAELLDHLGGFAEVAPASFGAPLLYLSQHPIEQQQLQAELIETLSNNSSFNQSQDEDYTGSPDLSIYLASLKYLDAVICESLRLRPIQPVSQPRTTSKDRATSIGPFTNIPSGTRVQSYFWILHHNEHIFPNAATWDPERWLVNKETPEPKVVNGDQSRTRRTPRTSPRDNFLAFSSGTRGCIGRSLAMEMLRHFLATVYSTYTTTIVSDADYGTINSNGTRFLRQDSSASLYLRFQRLKSKS